ncbi:neutral/alkaline non-lysosomal ceramidase N-terminal domain-containing protein [Niabella beijingensis]|uniref:neutral/alkaline non-lysosomal ceramidase N-terminal domain-containing protein n=1 Tax=Niabella beijingensis TaxID=2872700 RepID=UPI001CBBFB04|nr:neutral/alkaline non-lysosomal ceramidase N-terminal domain-containing protein [Niabella beijingensis]MBZ4191174.1 neutral/alkaline non-lysosomal ceramidase N-terminal domain-containing protein [Niabella beijingensis]
MRTFFLVLLLQVVTNTGVAAQTVKAGVGRKVITPEMPYWLTGYAARSKPAVEKIHDLWTKALVIETDTGNKVAFVTTDVLGLTPEIHTMLVSTLGERYGFRESDLVFNASHTHSGPMIWPSLEMIGDFDSSAIGAFAAYKKFLIRQITGAVEMAMDNLLPARLSTGHGTAAFAMNRRQPVNGKIINGKNPGGNKDHDVPVLKVTNTSGVVRAILFGYACHNTTMGGDNYRISGDYAGFAQLDLEQAYPGATALFFTGCAGDQNPQPRGTVALAEQHGRELSGAVKAVLAHTMRPVGNTVKSAMRTIPLSFVPFDVRKYKEELEKGTIFEQRRARLMLQAYNRGWEVTRYWYPVQVLRFGKDLTFISLGGEVVVDYALRLKEMYPRENLFVSGYCNHVMGYIPTKKILKEGGYEANENLIYYGMPGPFREDVEETIVSALRQVLRRLGVK